MSQPRLGRARGCRGRERADWRWFFGGQWALERLVTLRPFGLSGLNSHSPRVQGRGGPSAARANPPGNGTLIAWVSL
jgi:hypothetical protein